MADSIHTNGIPTRPPGAIPAQALSHLMGHQVFPQQQQQLFRPNRPPISYPPTPIVANQPRTPGVQYSNLVGAGERQLPTPAMTATMLPSTPLSTSQAVLKLMQFSDRLTPDGQEATSREVWDTFVDEFFSRTGCIKLTLCNTNNGEKKTHFVPQLVMARFFMTQYECGVISMQLTLDQTVEYFLPNGMLLECPRSSFIFRYASGSLVVFSGTLTARLTLDVRSATLKIAHLDFEVLKHEEFVARQNLQTSTPQKKSKQSAKKSTLSMPESPVGEWGLPPRIINLLQMTSSVTSFAEVVFTSLVAGVPPQEGLQMCAQYGTPGTFPNR